jgi:hypothetical protein
MSATVVGTTSSAQRYTTSTDVTRAVSPGGGKLFGGQRECVGATDVWTLRAKPVDHLLAAMCRL